MKIFRYLYGLCIFVLFLLISWAFVYALFEKELVIAMLCPVAFASLRGMFEIGRIIIAEKEEKRE